jgi:hypothetical protein
MLAIGLTLFYSTATPLVAAIYNLSRDFLTITNPAGPWSYGWKSNSTGSFSLLSYHSSEPDPSGGVWEHWFRLPNVPASVYRNSGTATLIANNGQGVYPPGTVWFGPGSDGNADNFCVIRFTTPPGAGGVFKIATAVRPSLNGAIAGDTDFHVVHNGSELFGRNLPPDSTTGYTNVLGLADGDTIDFLAGRGVDGKEYGGGLKISAAITRSDGLSIRVSQIELCWPTETNKWHQVQYRSALTTNQWMPLHSMFIPGTGGIFCTNDMVAEGEPQRFYQLVTTNAPP